MKQRTMARLFLSFFCSLAARVLSSFMAGTLALLQWTWKTSSANSIILSFLALSVLTNLFYSSRETSEWWHDRNAGKFMTRVGVGPNSIMSKAVYLRDIDDVVSTHTTAALAQYDGNPWYVYPTYYHTFNPLTKVKLHYLPRHSKPSRHELPRPPSPHLRINELHRPPPPSHPPDPRFLPPRPLSRHARCQLRRARNAARRMGELAPGRKQQV